MIEKKRKEKSKIINRAQKTTTLNKYSSHIVNDKKVIVQIPKEEMDNGLASILTIGIMFAFKEMDIKDIDVTIKENKLDYEIIVEK